MVGTPTLRRSHRDPNSRFLVLHAESEMAPLTPQNRFTNFKPTAAIQVANTSSTWYRRYGHPPGARLGSTWVIGDPLRRLSEFPGTSAGAEILNFHLHKASHSLVRVHRATDCCAIGKSHVDRRRYQVGRPRNCTRTRPPECNDSLAAALTNLRGTSRGNNFHFLRRRPDSNRSTGLCRPLPNHSATPPEVLMLLGGSSSPTNEQP